MNAKKNNIEALNNASGRARGWKWLGQDMGASVERATSQVWVCKYRDGGVEKARWVKADKARWNDDTGALEIWTDGAWIIWEPLPEEGARIRPPHSAHWFMHDPISGQWLKVSPRRQSSTGTKSEPGIYTGWGSW